MSWQMRTVAAVVKVTAKPWFATEEGGQKLLAQAKGVSRPPRFMTWRSTVSARRVEGREVWTVGPRSGRTKGIVIYLHGGTYVSEIAPEQWLLIWKMATGGYRVEVPIYGLAPQHTAAEACDFVTEVYRELVAEVPPSSITLAGDSAGGGLALAVAEMFGEAQLPQPGRLLLIAPWLDVEMRNPEVPAAEARDPWLSAPGLRTAGIAWAGDLHTADPRVSPIYGPLEGLAPLSVFVGTHDMLYPDVLRLAELCGEAGVPVDLTVCEDAVHDYPLTPTPEGRAARKKIMEQLA